jgi:hypothetical protein
MAHPLLTACLVRLPPLFHGAAENQSKIPSGEVHKVRLKIVVPTGMLIARLKDDVSRFSIVLSRGCSQRQMRCVMFRFVHITTAWLACLLAAACVKLQAADQMTSVEGVVVSAQAGRLVVKDDKSVDHSHSVDSSAQIMIEGKMAELEDLKKGMQAHVTIDDDNVISVTVSQPTKADRSRQ